MKIIQNGMSIQCRTEDEYNMFFEVARREGYMWVGSHDIEPLHPFHSAQSFQIGYFNRNRVTHGSIDEKYGKLVNVEASQLFYNLLKSRRVKHGTD